MTDPFADTARASLWGVPPPGKKPRPTIPVAGVQRNASPNTGEAAEVLDPATTVPSADTPRAALTDPPGKKPRPTMPVVGVQRNASPVDGEAAEALTPTTAIPFAETAKAWLKNLPPGRSPSGMKSANAGSAPATNSSSNDAQATGYALIMPSSSLEKLSRADVLLQIE
jgi:hypothetical protein